MCRQHPARVWARWIAIAALLVLLAACGGGDEAESPSADAAPAATVAPPDITTPSNGDIVHASAELGDNISAKVRVRGTAAPGRKLDVSADCQIVGCKRTADADEQGRFGVDVNVTVDASEPSIAIVAQYQDTYDSDRVVVTVGEPTPEPSRKRGSRSSPRRTGTPEPDNALPTATATATATASRTAPPALTS